MYFCGYKEENKCMLTMASAYKTSGPKIHEYTLVVKYIILCIKILQSTPKVAGKYIDTNL